MTASGEVLRVADLPGRGRALVASRPIRAGEVVLSDSPLLLYPASLPSLSYFCSACFRCLPACPIACPSCRAAAFCSASCAATSHPRVLCAALAHPATPLASASPEDQEALLFLLSACSLPEPSLRLLLSLSSLPPSPSQNLGNLHVLLATLAPAQLLPPGFSPELTAALLGRDRTNSFAIMEPFSPEVLQGHRKMRAYVVYPRASLLNHDCLPNAGHFDYVDRPGPGNADIIVRALHDITEGREVCISYFGTNWSYADRQRRLLEDYGFHCECDRCRIESQWKNDDDNNGGDEDDAMEEENEEGGDGGGDDGMEQEEGEGGDDEDDFPHAYFFVRYLCDREGCGGTLAPLPPSPEGVPSHVLECNVCRQLRKEEDATADGDTSGMVH